jgi:small-conductance mechanosensitive channel
MSSTAGALVTAAVVASVLVIGGPVVRLVLRRRHRDVLAADLGLLTWPIRLLAATLFARIAVEGIAHDSRIEPLIATALLGAVTWLLVRGLAFLQRVVLHRLDIDVVDNRRARGRVTQIGILRRILTVVVVLGAVAVFLLTLTPISRVGASLVAYAGVIGVVLGLALRAPLENLVAGIVVAVTEPIRIDDVVVVEGEWGRVEEIGLLNASVRLWDDRRLVLPTAWFVSNPFENWTREGSAIVGSVHVWVDGDADVDAIRGEFTRVVRASPHWDGRACALEVVELAPHGVQLRGIASAASAGASWDLRCEVREALLLAGCVKDHLTPGGLVATVPS